MRRDDQRYDAIVVGSGITGGWAAKELTEHGLSVLLLEAGRAIRPDVDFPLPAPAEGGAWARVIHGLAGPDFHVIENLDALHEELKSRGTKITEGPEVRVYGMRELIVDDLYGFRLAFGEDAGG